MSHGRPHEKSVRIAVAGLGPWGVNLLRALSCLPRVVLVGAFEHSRERAQSVCESFPDLVILNDVESDWEKIEFDAIVIATPATSHFKLVKRALEGGKHVLVEKPLAGNVREARELCCLSDEHNVTVMVGHVYLYNDTVRRVERIIRQNEFGPVVKMTSLRLNNGPIRHDVNVLWDLAPHDIALFNFLSHSLPLSVTCTGRKTSGSPHEDLAEGTLRYPGGHSASFSVSWTAPKKVRRMTFSSSERVLHFDELDPATPLTLIEPGGRESRLRSEIGSDDPADVLRSADREIHPPPSGRRPLDNECRAFVEHILDPRREPPISDHHFGAEVVAILEALTMSMHSSSAVVECEPYYASLR